MTKNRLENRLWNRMEGLVFRSLGTTLRALWTCILRATAVAFLPIPLKLGIDQILLLGIQPSTRMHFLENQWTEMFPSQEMALYGSAAMLFAFAVAAALLTRMTETNSAAAAQQIVEGLRENVLEKLMHVRQTYFKTHRAHELAARISQDNSIIENAISSGLIAVGFAVPAALLSVSLMAFADTRLALLLIIAMPILYSVTAQSARQWTVHRMRAQRETDHFERDVAQSLESLTQIKNFDMERPVLSKLMARLRLTQSHVSSSERAQAWAQARQELLKNGLRAGVLAVGGLFFMRGQTSLGSVVLFLIYVETVPNAISNLAEFRGQMRASARAIERITELEDSLNSELESEGARGVSSLPFPDANNLCFEDVTVDETLTPEAEQLGLKNFNAEFEPGELVSIVSEEDASPFAALLNRIIEPGSGRILIGSTEITKFKLSVLRRLVTVIDRDPFFFHGTVRENLLLDQVNRTEIDDEKISMALSAAGVDFITSLPERLDTVIGDGGFELTKEHAIRLSFARAFLKMDTKIFIFNRVSDELESEQADAMFESLRVLTERGSLVFWVTERMSDVQKSDRVVFLRSSAGPQIDSEPARLGRAPEVDI